MLKVPVLPFYLVLLKAVNFNSNKATWGNSQGSVLYKLTDRQSSASGTSSFTYPSVFFLSQPNRLSLAAITAAEPPADSCSHSDTYKEMSTFITRFKPQPVLQTPAPACISKGPFFTSFLTDFNFILSSALKRIKCQTNGTSTELGSKHFPITKYFIKSWLVVHRSRPRVRCVILLVKTGK